MASDHHLLIAKLRLKLKRYSEIHSRNIRYNVNHLKDQERKSNFCITLYNKYSALQHLDEENVESHLLHVKEALTSTCETVLGKKEHQHKDWISTETLKKIQERKAKKADLCNSKTRASKAIAQEKYANTNKEVKMSIRADKRNYIDNLAKEAEEAAAKGNMRDLFDNTKKLAGKYQQTS